MSRDEESRSYLTSANALALAWGLSLAVSIAVANWVLTPGRGGQFILSLMFGGFTLFLLGRAGLLARRTHPRSEVRGVNAWLRTVYVVGYGCMATGVAITMVYCLVTFRL